jgi:hypothetical protein
MAIGTRLAAPKRYASQAVSGFYLLADGAPHWVTNQEYLPAASSVPEFLIEVEVQYLP